MSTTSKAPLAATGEGRIQPTRCDSDNDGIKDGIQTAVGCIPTEDTNRFVAWILARAIGLGGGIAFLLMIFGGFQIITSSGDPKKLQAWR